MRILIITLVLIFNLQSWTKADTNSISDFEIEGMSIGDSLLDYFEEIVIKADLKKYKNPYKNDDFRVVGLDWNLKKNYELNTKVYDVYRFHVKKGDSKYKIYHIGGKIIYWKKDFKKCIKQKDEVANQLEKLFGSDKREEGKLKNHSYDKTGNSKTISTYFRLSDGTIRIICYNWSEEIIKSEGWIDSLQVVIYSDEFLTWLNNEAY